MLPWSTAHHPEAKMGEENKDYLLKIMGVLAGVVGIKEEDSYWGLEKAIQARYKRLNLPFFDRNNPDGWVSRRERFFIFYRLSELNKVEAIVLALVRDALFQYQWEHKDHPIGTWEETKALLLQEFRAMYTDTLYEQWLDLEQTKGVQQFRQRFIELLAPWMGCMRRCPRASS